MLSPYLVLSFFAPLVLGKTTAPNLQLHEALDNVPAGFMLSGPAAPDTVLNIQLALVQNNVSGLVDELYSVSDPSSANYGQYLSKEEVEALVAPSLDSVTAVNSWLSLNGLNATIASPAGDWLAVQVPVSKANEILSANYSVFTHVSTGLRTVRTLAYSIPTDLVGHLDLLPRSLWKHSSCRFLSSGIRHRPKQHNFVLCQSLIRHPCMHPVPLQDTQHRCHKQF